MAVNPTATPSEPVVYAIAFIFGTQERRFFNFLSEVAALACAFRTRTRKPD